MNNPIISIIIPVYNAESTIGKCLDSVLEQDIDRKEIICVDDGSTDSSVQIIKEYQRKNTEIVLFHQENMGAGIARNNGLAHATGKFVAFMDSDDSYLDSSGLRWMTERCIDCGYPICGGNVFNDINGSIVRWNDCFYSNDNLKYGESKTVKYIDYQYDYGYQGYIFERILLTEHNLKFPFYRRFQDPPFLVKALFYAQKYLVMNVDLYCYTSFSRYVKRTDVQVNDMILGLKDNLEFSLENNLSILWKRTIDRIDGEFYGIIKTSITEGNMEAISGIVEIQKLIDKVNIYGERILEIYKWIEGCLTNKQGITDVSEYQFPYDKIPYDSRIILYGAGHVGKGIKKLIDYTGYCKIVAWVDKRYEEDALLGYGVVAPESITGMDADYVLIAVDSDWLYNSIKLDLKSILNGRQLSIIGPVHRIHNRNKSSVYKS